jgi:hypothetical protein
LRICPWLIPWLVLVMSPFPRPKPSMPAAVPAQLPTLPHGCHPRPALVEQVAVTSGNFRDFEGTVVAAAGGRVTAELDIFVSRVTQGCGWLHALQGRLYDTPRPTLLFDGSHGWCMAVC